MKIYLGHSMCDKDDFEKETIVACGEYYGQVPPEETMEILTRNLGSKFVSVTYLGVHTAPSGARMSKIEAKWNESAYYKEIESLDELFEFMSYHDLMLATGYNKVTDTYEYMFTDKDEC